VNKYNLGKRFMMYRASGSPSPKLTGQTTVVDECFIILKTGNSDACAYAGTKTTDTRHERNPL